MTFGLAIALALIAAVSSAQAGDRLPILSPEQMSPEQTKLIQALLSGPRGGGDASPDAVNRMLQRGPFNAWLRSPELGSVGNISTLRQRRASPSGLPSP